MILQGGKKGNVCLLSKQVQLFYYVTDFRIHIFLVPIPVAARPKALVCGRLLAGIVGSNPAGGHKCLSLVSVVCCKLEITASGWSVVQRSPTECGVSECDHESSAMMRPWLTGLLLHGKKIFLVEIQFYDPNVIVCFIFQTTESILMKSHRRVSQEYIRI